MVDPEKARAILRDYYATASDQQIVEDLLRISPKLAARLEVTGYSPPKRRARPLREFLASFGRSVHCFFS